MFLSLVWGFNVSIHSRLREPRERATPLSASSRTRFQSTLGYESRENADMWKNVDEYKFQSTLGYESRENEDVLGGGEVHGFQSTLGYESRENVISTMPVPTINGFNPLSATRAERTEVIVHWNIGDKFQSTLGYESRENSWASKSCTANMFQSTLGYESRENVLSWHIRHKNKVSIHSRLREPREPIRPCPSPPPASFNPLSATRAERTHIPPAPPHVDSFNPLSATRAERTATCQPPLSDSWFQSTLGYESRENGTTPRRRLCSLCFNPLSATRAERTIVPNRANK